MEMQMATWSIARTAAALGFTGALLAAALTFRAPHQYMASGVVQTAAPLDNRLPGLQREVLSRSFLSAIIIKEDLYKAERREDPIEDIVDRMRRENVRMALDANGTLRVSFIDDDPARAQRIAHWIMNQMVYLHPTDFRPASLPESPGAIPPSRWPTIAYGLAAGLLAGAFGAWLYRQPWRWTLRMAAFTIGGALLGCGMFYSWYFGTGPIGWIPDHFTSTVVLRSSNGPALEKRIVTNEVLQSAISNAALYRSQGGRVDLMRRDLQIVRQPSVGNDLLIVSFAYTDRYKAQRALRAIADTVSDTRTEMVDPPNVADLGRFRTWHFLTAGVLLGLAAGVIRRRPRRTLRLSHA
jgi:hypothetical protein